MTFLIRKVGCMNILYLWTQLFIAQFKRTISITIIMSDFNFLGKFESGKIFFHVLIYVFSIVSYKGKIYGVQSNANNWIYLLFCLSEISVKQMVKMSIYLDKIRHAFTKKCLVSKHVLCSKFDLSKTFYRIRQFVFTPLFSLFFHFDKKLRILDIIKLVNDEKSLP